MRYRPLRQTIFPLITAFIWGTAFVAQSVGAEHLEAMTVNAVRYAIAGAFLLPVLAFLRRHTPPRAVSEQRRARRELLTGGLACGFMLALSSGLQQFGIAYTTAGKAGFITALYIVLVPLLGLFFHKRVPLLIWGSVAIAVAGLYLLCIKEDFSIGMGDVFMLLCALSFSGHILVIDHFTSHTDSIPLACAQFFFAALFSGFVMLFFEHPTLHKLQEGIVPLLYLGIFSSGIAYTLQIVAQKDSDPTIISLLLSLESVFAVLAGAVLLNEAMSGREITGCLLMFVAVILAQLPTSADKMRS